MKSYLILAFVLFVHPGPGLWAQAPLVDDDASRNSTENRLAKSAAALRTFQENVSDTPRECCSTTHTALVWRPGAIGRPRRRGRRKVLVRLQSKTGMKPGLTGGGGDRDLGRGRCTFFWPVVGTEIDLIILATNQSTTSQFGDREGMLGSPEPSYETGSSATGSGPPAELRVSPCLPTVCRGDRRHRHCWIGRERRPRCQCSPLWERAEQPGYFKPERRRAKPDCG